MISSSTDLSACRCRGMAPLTLVTFGSDMLFAAFLRARHAGAQVRVRRRGALGAVPHCFETIERRFSCSNPDTGFLFPAHRNLRKSLLSLLPVTRPSVLMSNSHDPDVIVCQLVADRKWKSLHQNTSVGSEIPPAHSGIQAQKIQYCAKLVVKLGAQAWELSVVIVRDFLRLPVSRGMKRDSHSMRTTV